MEVEEQIRNETEQQSYANDDATKILDTGHKLTDTPNDLDTKTRLLARLDKRRNLNVIIRNINDITSMAQTADGAMEEITNILQREKEIIGKAGDGSHNLDDSQTQEYIEEYTALTGEVNRIVQVTSFGQNNILDGSFSFRTIKIGEGPKDTITFSMPDLRKAAEKLQKIDAKSKHEEAVSTVDSVLAHVNGERSKMSALLDRLTNALSSLDNVVEQTGPTPASLWSFPSEQATLSKQDLLWQAGQSMLATANAKPKSLLTLLG